MKRIIRLTESDLVNIVKRVIMVEGVNTDISKMSNTEVYNLVTKLVKKDPNRAMVLLDQIQVKGPEQTNDLNMLKTFVKSIKDKNPIDDANYMGKRFKLAGDITQQLINTLETGPYVGGFGSL
jgi:hypothetical protein